MAMAILNKFFSSRKKIRQHFVIFGKNENESWKPFEFSTEQVRVLLFRECDSRRRKLLFDSSSVQKVALDKSSSATCSKSGSRFASQKTTETKKTEPIFVEVSNGYGYQYTRPKDDVNLLSDMIFGTVPLTFQGSSMKVHSMKSPPRLMCTKVFPSPGGNQGNRVSEQSLDDSFEGSSTGSLGEAVLCESGTFSMGEGVEAGRGSEKRGASEEDSGFCGDASLRSTISFGSSNCTQWMMGEQANSVDSRESSCSSVGSLLPHHSSGSLSSLQRRWWRHLSTSMEFCPSPSGGGCTPGGRRSKLGLAILVTLSDSLKLETQEQTFFFDHISVIENMMNRLKTMVEKAYLRKDTFVHLLKESAEEIQQAMVDLFSAPRVPHPVWLGLVSSSSPSSHSQLARTFLGDLCHLLSSLDTKSSNFFVSTLVTAVLTHHLGWVPTVLPGTSPPLSSHSNKTPNQMLDSLAKSHPYNALWAQLSDLQGALGHPVRVARTVVTGRHAELLNRLVRVLSYFVRCGAVLQRHEERAPSDVEDLSLLTPLHSPLHHARELSSSTIHPCSSNSTFASKNGVSSCTLAPIESSKKLGIHRTSSCLSQLANQNKETHHLSPPSIYPSLSEAQTDLDLISEKVSKLCRVPTEAIMCHLQSFDQEEKLRNKVEAEKQLASKPHEKLEHSCYNSSLEELSKPVDNVIFVLGENEKLIGIKQPLKEGNEESHIVLNETSENIRETSLYLKSYHSVRFHAERCDEGEDCCLMLGGGGGRLDCSESESLSSVVPCVDVDTDEDDDAVGPRLLELAMPASYFTQSPSNANSFAASLLGYSSEHYIADFVLQACTQDPKQWKNQLRRDLALAAHQPLLDKEVTEAVCVLANTDTWEVQVVSSHTYVVDQPGNMGVRQGMSQLVANMLEAVQQLWSLHTPPELCLQHLESKLREMCLHSHALAQLLLASDCCEMQQLTSALNLEANDVPLLLSVASTHTPQVTQRYGLSFR